MYQYRDKEIKYGDHDDQTMCSSSLPHLVIFLSNDWHFNIIYSPTC